MRYLIDTNVISELRKGKKADLNVCNWFEKVKEEDIFISVLTLGEIRKGIEQRRHRGDETQAKILEMWLQQIEFQMKDRILPITNEIADCWGKLGVPNPLPVIDSLIAATALVHNLTLVTRNVKDIKQINIKMLNPFL